VPAILPLNSTPNGIIDDNPSSSAAPAGTGLAKVIILMLPAKSSHESPAGKGIDDSIAAGAERECTVEEGTKTMASNCG
jgi:hypothetical protein